jgi:hypothetical protein
LLRMTVAALTMASAALAVFWAKARSMASLAFFSEGDSAVT